MRFSGRRPRGMGRHLARGAVFLLLLPCLLALVGWVVQQLWNQVVVEVTDARPVSLWQALGLLLLCRILVGRWGHGRRGPWAGGRGPWAEGRGPGGTLQDKWRSMSPEQRDRFRSRWQGRCATPGQGTGGGAPGQRTGVDKAAQRSGADGSAQRSGADGSA